MFLLHLVSYLILKFPAITSFCKIFLNFQAKYFRHKKIALPSFESLEEAKLVQGSSLVIAERVESREACAVVFNYKVFHESGLVKSIGRYHSNENFISCLQNLNSASDK
jgi:hypothetical protein